MHFARLTGILGPAVASGRRNTPKSRFRPLDMKGDPDAANWRGDIQDECLRYRPEAPSHGADYRVTVGGGFGSASRG